MTKTEMSRNKALLRKLAAGLDDLGHELLDASLGWYSIGEKLTSPSVAACIEGGAAPEAHAEELREMARTAFRYRDGLLDRVEALDAVRQPMGGAK